MSLPLDRRPVIVALAGPNGAGKTTFSHAHLRPAALRFINADVLTRELELDAYAAARVADALRRQLVGQRESYLILPTNGFVSRWSTGLIRIFEKIAKWAFFRVRWPHAASFRGSESPHVGCYRENEFQNRL